MTAYSKSESPSELTRSPRLKVTSVPLLKGPPLIAPPGRANVGVTLGLFPAINSPAPESVEEVMQSAPVLVQMKAAVAVPSSRNCKPFGMLSVNWTLVKLPSGSCAEMR